MKRNKKLLIVTITLTLLMLLAGCAVPEWLYGHDNGEAYKTYTEQMEQMKKV